MLCRLGADEIEGSSTDAMGRHIEGISRCAGRPCSLDTHLVRGLLREWRRFQAMLSVLRRPPSSLFTCAACTPRMSVMCVDGIFKLWRYSRDYSTWREPVVGKPGDPGSLYVEPALVKRVLSSLECASADLPGEPCKTCGTSDIAALRSKTHGGKHKMDVTGSYMSCCAHSMFLKAFDFHGGERHSFAVAMHLLLPDAFTRVDVICGDTMCQIGRRFESLQSAHDAGKLNLPDGVTWKDVCSCAYAVNAMHVRGVRSLLLTQLPPARVRS